MKKTLITLIILFGVSMWINAQTNQKGIRFYIGNTFSRALEVSDRGNSMVLTQEINNLQSSVSNINFGLSYDVWNRKNTFISVGCNYLFTGNNLRNSTLNNNTYTYRIEMSSIAIPVEIRHYVYLKKESRFSVFLTGAFVPSILLDSKLRRKENIFDSNKKYESTIENDVNSAKFYPVNAWLNLGFGIEYKPLNRKASVWISPQYNFQINPTWSEGIKQNISTWGITVGTHFPIK